jgi:prepilin-type N-terminal cleavage/methylation domain-containing protein
MRTYSQNRRPSGFSLIEVMIAVIVLATGLLALAALQINLTRSAADAKARSRMAALLETVIDYQRSQGYSSLTAGTTTTSASSSACSTATNSVAMFVKCAQNDAGVSGVTVSETITQYFAADGASSFGTAALTTAQQKASHADYKWVTLTANWTDASGTARSFGTSMILDDAFLNNAKTLLTQNITTSASMTPTVHESNPSNTAGVIPIAVGTNTNSAATNPKPTVQTSGASSTTFSTLQYTQGTYDGTKSSTIQKRVDTTVASCVCVGSTSNPFTDTSFLGAAVFRPTYWNGTQYASPSTVSGLTPFAAVDSSVTQSDLCNQCCRDHLDQKTPGSPSNTVPTPSSSLYSAPLYDEVTGDANRYKVAATCTTKHSVTTCASNTPVTLAGSVGSRQKVTDFTDSTQPWLDSCRLIRVDGLWRVAADLRALQMGLLATSPEGFATSATPASSAEDAYEDFVIDYLGQYVTYIISGGSAPVANTIFASHGLNVPDIIEAVTTTGSYRYLHARGLYLDYLETAAVTKLTNLKSSSSCTNNYPTCILQYLPFATVNLTYLGYGTKSWSSSSTTKATVGSGAGSDATGTCSSSNGQTGGCVAGKSSTTSNITITADFTTSNSAVAASLYTNPVEETSSNRFTDTQAFSVTGTSTVDEYFAQLSGPSVTLTDPTLGTTSTTVTWLTSDASTTNEPTVQWGFGVSNVTAGPDSCFSNLGSSSDTNPNPFDCVTTVLLSGVPTTQLNTTIGNYNQIINNPITNPCSGGTGSVNLPTLVCYTVSAVTLTTDSAATNRIDCYGNGSTSKNCYNISTPYTVSSSKTTGETTTITIASQNQNPSALSKPYLNVTFIANGTQAGTYTCNAANVPTFTNPTSCP